MDNNINGLTPCIVLTGVLWVLGVIGFVLISAGLLDARHGGISLVVFTMGCLFYLRRLVKVEHKERSAAFELGRLSVEGGRVRPIH